MATLQTLRADSSDTTTVADLLGETFHDIAIARWLVLNPAQRAHVLPAYLRIHVEQALRYGEVHMTVDRSAVAVWLQHERPLPEPAAYPTRLALACGQWADRFLALDTVRGGEHLTGPHHDLFLLAVRPDSQTADAADALLRHHHGYLDQRGLPGYVQACTPRGRELYRQHGYQPLPGDLTMPDGSPLWPMWRPATRTASAPHG